jgi:uncharacterized membrane protein HdeD (DUF308 family)
MIIKGTIVQPKSFLAIVGHRQIKSCGRRNLSGTKSTFHHWRFSMNDTDTPLGGFYGFSLTEFQKNRGWFLALGILLIVAGTLAIIYDVAATLLSVLFFGWLLIIMGAIEAVQSFWQPRWGGLFLHLMVGILAVVVGFHLVSSPAAGALVLTWVMAIYFMVIGIFRIIAVIAMQFPNWGWVLLSGIITFILGVLIRSQWPISGLWIIGLFIGIDMIFSGWSYVMLALAVKKEPTPA